MRSLALVLTGLSILAAAPALAGGQQRGGWSDTPTMPLNMPGRTIAPPPMGGWHGHDVSPPRPQPSGWQGGGWQGGDVRQGSWHGGGDQHRGGQTVRHGEWHGGYARPYRGYRLDRVWLQPGYSVSNWGFYGLGEPGYGRHWVRYYDDAVLIDAGGTVYDSVEGLDWDRPAYADDQEGRAGWNDEVGYGAKYGGMAPGSYYAPPAPVAQPAPPLAYAPPPPPPAYAPPVVTYGSAVSYVAPVASTVVIQSAPTVTTTTTTTTFVEEVYRRPVRRWTPKPVHRAPRRIVCCCLCR